MHAREGGEGTRIVLEGGRDVLLKDAYMTPLGQQETEHGGNLTTFHGCLQRLHHEVAHGTGRPQHQLTQCTKPLIKELQQ